MAPTPERRSVAVVGSGVAGLSAAYLMHRNGRDVTLFEAGDAYGGHALTVDSTAGPVDLGFQVRRGWHPRSRGPNQIPQPSTLDARRDAFDPVSSPPPCLFFTLNSPPLLGHPSLPQVFNLTTYPHLVGLFNELGVASERSDMSFALSTDDVEWGSLGLGAVFAQPGNAVRPAFLNMIREVFRFGKRAPEVLKPENASTFEGMTLGEYLARERYSVFFRENYVVPMCAAIWSCSDRDTMAFPVITLIRFWVNHHLLNVVERPLWRVVKGRSKAYVDAVVAALPEGSARLRTAVVAAERLAKGGVELTLETRSATGKTAKKTTKKKETFDDVIFACHSDQTLAILGDAAEPAERAALAAIKYQPNEVYLHSDPSLMPRARRAWASWNCLKGSRGTSDADDSVCVSYWVNLLQNLPEGVPDLFVTLNPPRPPAADTIQHHVTLAHPLFNQAAIDAQKTIADAQGLGGVWFAGAWCGYGFHEDGIKSAVDVAERMFAGDPSRSKGNLTPVPWDPRPCDPHLSLSTKVCIPLFARVGGSWVPPGRCFRMILPDGSELAMRGKSLPEGVESLGVGVDGKPLEEEVVVTVFDQSMFLRSVLRADIGLGESYMDGHFDCDLYALLDLLCSGHPANVGAAAGADSGVPSLGKDLVGLVGSAMHWLGAKMEFAAHAALSNTKEGSKKNIEYHYDAGNAFYRLFLDDTMLYSSGIHQPLDAGPCTVGSALGHIPEDDFEAREKHLEEAQYAKIDAMLDRLDLQPNDHILEIGCGWGACAIRAARRAPGIRVTGLTISNEQFAEAKARVKAAGLENRVDIVMRDYRDVAEVYDKVISVEMLEAVGHEHLPTFFSVVSRALKPGGKAAIQVITMPDERYESYCKSESDFIRAYIFPGGHLPSVGAMTAAASAANLRLASYDDIGEHYAVTLRLWRERMMARAETVLGLGYSRKFLRMFEFYFAYCEAGFAHRLIHDLQMTWVKDGADAADDPRSIATASATAQASVRERDASWFLAAISLVAWTAHACATRSRWAPAIFVAVAAAAAAHFFILVAVAAALAAIGAPDKTTNDALLARAARTARPLTSAALSFAAAVAAAATTTNGAATSLDSLADHLSAARAPANEHRLAAVAVAASGALAALRLIAAVTAGSAPEPGVTRSSHDARVGADVARLATCAWALCGEQYLPAVAFSVLAAAHAGAEHFRKFAKIAAGFPHGDSALRRVSFPAAAAAFLVARFAPHAAAAAALTPRAAAAVVAVAPKTASALAVGVSAAFAAGPGAPAAAAAAAEAWVAARTAAAPVALAAAAAAACAADVAAFAKSSQEKRAETAVRERIVRLATSAEV